MSSLATNGFLRVKNGSRSRCNQGVVRWPIWKVEGLYFSSGWRVYENKGCVCRVVVNKNHVVVQEIFHFCPKCKQGGNY